MIYVLAGATLAWIAGLIEEAEFKAMRESDYTLAPNKKRRAIVTGLLHTSLVMIISGTLGMIIGGIVSFFTS